MEEKLILICEDSLEGIFTGIYEAYVIAAKRSEHSYSLAQIELQTGDESSLQLFATYRTVAADSEKAGKVMHTLCTRLGGKDYRALCMALSAPDAGKAQAVFHTVVWGLSGGWKGSILDHLSDDYVRTVMQLAQSAERECQHLKGFLRFQELEGGLLYAAAAPKYHLIALLAVHFADRLPMENFVILDEGRDLYAVHPAGKEWFLMAAEEGEMSAEGKLILSAEEEYYQELFRCFCHTICIEGRRNLKLQRNMLPLHFRKYMVEFAEK